MKTFRCGMSVLAISLLLMASLARASELDDEEEVDDSADDDEDGEDLIGEDVVYDEPPPTFQEVLNRTRRLGGPAGKIVGGEEVTDQDRFPWVTSLYLDGFQCGGALLGEKGKKSKWVLTAAHCVEGLKKKNMYVFYRRLDESLGWQKEVAIRKKVKKVYMHKGYDSETMYHDMTLLKLKGSILQHKTNVKLPKNLEFVNFDKPDNLRIAGWGATSDGGDSSLVMKTTTVPLLTYDKCNSPNYLQGMIHKKWHICAGFDEGGIDACQGDSGGPLFAEPESDTVVVIGVVSWGLGCAVAMQPGVYANVHSERKWIKKITKYKGADAVWYKTSSRRLLEEKKKNDENATVLI